MKRAATLLVAVTAACWGAAPALAAEGEPVTGYWTRTQTALPLPVQPPDPVPEGGMWVAADPSGPLAVSALRTELPAGLVAVELRLAVADAVGVPTVQACPSADRWAADQGGRLDGAPVADCSAPLEAAVDGDVLVVKLPAGLDAVNVLLRAAPGSAFSLTLERATAASVVTAPRPAGPYAPAPAAPAAPAASVPSGSTFESVALPPPPLLAVPKVQAPQAAQPAPAPQAAPAPVAAPVTRAHAAVASGDRRQSLLAVAVLALLALQAARLARQPAVVPRALGGAARQARPEPVDLVADPSGTPRGVGRFRTVRPRPPVRI